MPVTSLTVTPSTLALTENRHWHFAHQVNGSGNTQNVVWTTSAGRIDAHGQFTAPAGTTSPQTVTITATSTDNNTNAATATVTVAAMNGSRNAEFEAKIPLATQAADIITLPAMPGQNATLTVRIDNYALTLTRGVATAVPHSVKLYLQNIGAL